MSDSEHRGSGLNEIQWQQLMALTTSLNPAQTTWVSGFFAGLDYAARADLVPGGCPVLAAPISDPPTASSTRTVTILYGTETGNSAALAATLTDQAKARGLSVTMHDMAVYKCRQLKDEQDLVIIASTYGEGDPPQSAAGFFEFIEGHKAPKLPNLRFAVLALGDSTYEYFCEAGKRLDRRFEELGAQRLKPRLDCDVDYDEPAAAWIAEIAASLDNRRSHTGASTNPAQPVSSAQAQVAVFDKRNLFPATIIENIVLTGRGSSKETRHVELSLEGSGLSYEPGDALGFMPSNDPSTVDAVLTALDLAPSTPVKTKGGSTALGDTLRSGLEITTLTPRFLDHWARISDADALVRLTQADHASERASFIRNHHIIDVIRQFPVNRVDAETFVAGLRPLQPRLYSIASSLAVAPDEVHLTVSTVRYDLHGEPRLGVASGHLATHGELDGLLPVYIQKNPHFRLPADDVPIIMIGAGTGVAPYRAFMQEREARGASGQSWLFLGERNFRTDFLYQTEWQTLIKDGILTRMDVAFSRDRHADGEARIYVQHRLKEHARDVFAWLEEGAHLYVCGDAARLAPDVHLTLAAIVAEEGGIGAAAAEDYLQRLQRDGRYQRDVY
ncbi:assimilatory sulfite reductase (NADPH) flavoprotein subunit (plasmid) [Skermanella rosea]|uniref:assimilatory sulfite reductase (NADPH) flavoprotein subunit n=1 Tax=Skermanella rosea TaxID=1817965 RepID=UPI00193152E6|nr:assimilatory sulfite reductase (NADPH) flavoprotein subunit [Skermanella rosea]UEM07713.1 assimilatory sulfite reductase (NADPH) flavoprotein subunit [Skermanella rosea]